MGKSLYVTFLCRFLFETICVVFQTTLAIKRKLLARNFKTTLVIKRKLLARNFPRISALYIVKREGGMKLANVDLFESIIISSIKYHLPCCHSLLDFSPLVSQVIVVNLIIIVIIINLIIITIIFIILIVFRI